jgi:large subunit ribosomal protein L25
MSDIMLEATVRTDAGKGASRRLRRLENQVPAVVYGGTKKPAMVMLPHNKVIKALENEAIFSSVFDLELDGKKQKVILKDLQRHPFKPIIMHIDFQRVSSSDVLTKIVPIHFLNQDTCKGVKSGGIVNHVESQVEIRCKAKDLPEFIAVDMANVELDQTIHLSEITLPKGVELTADISDSAHDHPVVAVHLPKREEVSEETEETTEAEVPATQQSKGDESSTKEDSE